MFTIPPRYKIHNGCDKFLLKKAVHDLLPKEIIQRKKAGFGVPYHEWMKGECKEWIISDINDSKIISEYFSSKEIEKIISYAYKKNERSSYLPLWNLFALTSWYNVYFNNAQ